MGSVDLKYGSKIIIFTLLLIIELFAHNYWLERALDTRTAFYFVAGLLIVLIPMWKILPKKKEKNSSLIFYLGLFFFAGLIAYAVSYMPGILSKWPVAIEMADMLPVITKMSERFIEGKEVYAVIPEIWGGMQPIYLPTMWMPYVPAVFLDFDIRWISFGLILLGLFFTIILIPDFKKRNVWSLAPLIPAFCFFLTLGTKDARLIGITEEGVVLGFYLFLAFAFYRGNNFVKALALSFCLLSRYSLLIWAVMYFVYWFFYKSKRDAVITALMTGGIMLLLMFISQAIFHLEEFIKLPALYDKVIADPEYRWKYEPMIHKSLGFAKFFDYENLTTLSQIFKAQFFLVPFICLAIFRGFRKYLNEKMFLFCALKLSLLCFYGFIVMPFKYLFFTSTVFSIAIFVLMIETDREQSEGNLSI